jgi:hypothetical protein
MPASPADMMAAIVHNMPQRTGKTIDEWVDVVLTQHPGGTFEQRLQWLKSEQGLTHGQARAVISAAGETPPRGAAATEDPVAAQYGGAKAKLRPILEEILIAAAGLGDDVSITATPTQVSLERHRQFAVVRVATRATVELGLVLDPATVAGRLKPTGSLGADRVTHTIALHAVDDVDGGARAWLAAAYAQDGQ